MGKLDAAPDVFAYLDYRAFLRDHYESRKGRGFSFRAFARKANLGSPNYLKLVMDGERNLSGPMAARFARACGLEGDAAAYFEDLVHLGQARTSTERAAAYDRLKGFRRYRSVQKLELDHAEYHSTWYLPAIRELAARIYNVKKQQEDAKRAAERKTLVGSGDRSERIRTYNFPQNRLTDHRIGLTLYNLDQVIAGNLQPVTDALIDYDRQQLRDQMGGLD